MPGRSRCRVSAWPVAILALVSGCSLSYPSISPQIVESAPVSHSTQVLGEEEDRWGKALHVEAIGVSSDGSYLAVGGIFGLALYQVATLDNLWVSTTEQPLGIRSVTFRHDDDLLATGNRDGIVTIWNIKDGEPLYSIEGFELDITSLAFHPEGHLLAIGLGGGTVVVWDMEANQSLYTFKQPPVQEMTEPANTVVAWSPDGTMLAAGGWNKQVLIWDATTGELLNTLQHNYVTKSIAWSSDDSYLAVTTSEFVFIWDIETVRQETVLHQERTYGQSLPGGSVIGLSWSPNGKWIALGAWDGRISTWSAETYELVYTLKNHNGGVHSLQWTPEGDKLISASYDNTVIIWDIERGESIGCLWCEVQN